MKKKRKILYQNLRKQLLLKRINAPLQGAGIHLSERGGYLNIHADFGTHPRFNYLERRLNVILYLNKNWREEYKGGLEFWSADMKQCVINIAPLFNRCVIFNTTDVSFHGFPEAVLCPQSETRKSIALYYYTKTETNHRLLSSNYKTRPEELLKKFPNGVDNALLYIYTRLKSVIGIRDNFSSKLLTKKWFKRSN